jgi:hypothetical protein
VNYSEYTEIVNTDTTDDGSVCVCVWWYPHLEKPIMVVHLLTYAIPMEMEHIKAHV